MVEWYLLNHLEVTCSHVTSSGQENVNGNESLLGEALESTRAIHSFILSQVMLPDYLNIHTWSREPPADPMYGHIS